jgi:hypothetical protein
MAIPDFFIVGAPRCGTTALNHYLKQHPDIFIPDVKEMHFFGSDLLSGSIYRDKEKYLKQFEPARDEKRVGEASVWYLYSTTAPREIRDFNPLSKIIIMLRNPVDMIQSLHAKLLLVGDENIKDLKQALAAEEERKKGLRRPDGSYPVVTTFYRENARFAKHVKRYLDVFGPGKVHVIIHDDFQRDTAKSYQETLRFLEVDENFQPEFEVINEYRGVRSLKLHRIMQNMPQIAWTLRRALLPENFHIGGALMRLNTPAVARPEIDGEQKKELKEEFLPEVEKLSELLGRDLNHWCRE